MKITIDTKEDSPEDIRKVVALLSTLATNHISSSRNIFDDPAPALGDSPAPETPSETPTSAFASMFGKSPTEAQDDNNDDEDSSEEEKETPSRVTMY